MAAAEPNVSYASLECGKCFWDVIMYKPLAAFSQNESIRNHGQYVCIAVCSHSHTIHMHFMCVTWTMGAQQCYLNTHNWA